MSFLNRYLLQTLILWVWLFFVPVFADESHIYGSLRRRTISSRADSLRREWRKAQGGVHILIMWISVGSLQNRALPRWY